MKTECAECRAIALEMKAALADVQQHPNPAFIATDVRQRLRELFSSEESINKLANSGRNTKVGRAYSRWNEHRIAGFLCTSDQ
jgi:hypothetical protein